MKLHFSKYAGCGNDFILFDNRNQTFPSENRALISRLCHRHKGIGADGVILLENSQKADFRMRIFNSDGGEAEMCGNGIRCLLMFIHELGGKGSSYKIETFHRILPISFNKGNIQVEMSDPTDVRWDLKMAIDNQNFLMHHLDTGVPHAITFVDDINSFDIQTIGPKVRFHPEFAPKGANFNIASVDEKGDVSVRTYERGVEMETQACGTGATASAIAAAKAFGLNSPVVVHTKSGEALEIGLEFNNGIPTNVTMTGPATFIFSGAMDIADEAD